jgi:hypothetical protein
MEKLIMEKLTMEKLTIMNLFYFFNREINEYDRNIINKYIRELDENCFWLGGQIKLNHNDFINLELIEKVKKMNNKQLIDYGSSVNSFENMLIIASTRQLELIESMIIKYDKFIKLNNV